MKLQSLLFSTLLTTSCVFGFDIRLSPDTTLQFCRVIRVYPDSVDIAYTDSSTHEEGVTTLKYEELPADIRNQYFDSYNVTQYRKHFSESQEELRQRIVAANERAKREAEANGLAEEQKRIAAAAQQNAHKSSPVTTQWTPDVQYAYAIKCIEGIGIEKNEVLGVEWLLDGAKKGHVKSQSAIGYCYMTGCGVLQNLVESKKWLKLAAAGGDVTASKNLELIANAERKSILSSSLERFIMYFIYIAIIALVGYFSKKVISKFKNNK